MNRFSENLSYLRRRAGYTQESLAEAMGVSRQAVSKWESGQAMPEAATLVALADLLGCTLDQLMREELDALDPAEPTAGPEPEDRAALLAYGAHMDRFSLMMASGVALVLVGVALLLMAYLRFGDSGAVVLPLLGCLCVAVFLFVLGGISHEDFKKTGPELSGLWTAEELEDFRRRFRVGMALAVAAVLADVALLVFLCWRSGGQEAGCVRATSLFMWLLAGCVWVFVYLGIQHEKMEGPEKRRQEEDPLHGVIMMLATIIFLVLGFTRNLWHPAWVVFPVGGILCGILETVRKE